MVDNVVETEDKRDDGTVQRVEDGTFARARRRVHEGGVEFFESGADGSFLWLVRRAWQWCQAFVEGLNEWLAIRRETRARASGSADEELLTQIERGDQ